MSAYPCAYLNNTRRHPPLASPRSLSQSLQHLTGHVRQSSIGLKAEDTQLAESRAAKHGRRGRETRTVGREDPCVLQAGRGRSNHVYQRRQSSSTALLREYASLQAAASIILFFDVVKTYMVGTI